MTDILREVHDTTFILKYWNVFNDDINNWTLRNYT